MVVIVLVASAFKRWQHRLDYYNVIAAQSQPISQNIIMRFSFLGKLSIEYIGQHTTEV